MRRIVLFLLTVGAGSAQVESPDIYLMNLASGTSRNPEAASMPMLMRMDRSWMFSLMGQGFMVDTQQSPPRGGDKLYSTNWVMGSAEHPLAGGTLLLET